MHRFGGPAGAFPTTSAQQITAAAGGRCATDATTTTTTQTPTTKHPYGSTYDNNNAGPLRFAENECPISAAAFVVDCAAVGSLTSIQSAPPVPLADLNGGLFATAVVSTSVANGVNSGCSGSGSTTIAVPSIMAGRGLVNFELGPPDSPELGARGCRPISLALDAGAAFHSTKTIATMQQQQQHHHGTTTASEADEDDNENLLTVSSLTARPLIAKSHELRTTK